MTSLTNGIKILLCVFLSSSYCFAEQNETISPRKSAVALPNKNTAAKSAEQQAINFALSELNKADWFLHKEQIDEVLEVRKTHEEPDQYHLKLRLTRSSCKKGNSSCDTSYDWLNAKAQYNPIIAPLEPPMQPGKNIAIEGKIPIKSKGFDITIQTGSDRPILAQLRISVKFSQEGNTIQLKHFDESWNLDEHFDGIMKRKTHFSVSISCLSTRYQIYINGESLGSFNHILPFVDATHLSIVGEVDITSISGIGRRLHVNKFNPLPMWGKDDIKYQTSIYVPFTAPLDSPLTPGKSITIKGVVHPLAKWFSVYIQTGNNENTPEAVQLHVNSSFVSTEKKILLEYYDGHGHWAGLESYEQTIAVGRNFALVITCLKDKFKVSIDDKDVAVYDHKLPYEHATHLRIEGRVNITEVVGIDKIPPIHIINEQVGYHHHLPLEDLPLTPGRKIRMWAYILKDASWALFEIGDGLEQKNTILDLYFKCTNSIWTMEARTWKNGQYQQRAYNVTVDWFKAGEPIQIDLEYATDSFKVSFFNNYFYSAPLQGQPVSLGTHLSFYYGQIFLYGVSGVSLVPPISPPAPRTPFRICEVNVQFMSEVRDMWLNGWDCKYPRRSAISSEQSP